MRWGLAFLLLAMAVVSAGCEEKEPCDKPYSCPNRAWIDCQPVVLPEFQDMCYGECHEWIVEHCPDVEFYW